MTQTTVRNIDLKSKLIEIVEPVCTGAGYELVDLRFTLEQGGWILRVFIDYPPPPTAPGQRTDDLVRGVGLDDCERISRELSAVLDVEDPVPQAYSLEVSSPGLDRPLRTPAHFRRFLGETAKIAMTTGVEGRKNFKGTLEEADDTTVVVSVDGTSYRLPIDDIQTAKLVPDWDALLKAKASN